MVYINHPSNYFLMEVHRTKNYESYNNITTPPSTVSLTLTLSTASQIAIKATALLNDKCFVQFEHQ